MPKKIHINPLLVLLGVGVLLRATHYLDNLSFWADEAWVALTLTQRSIEDILLNQNLGGFCILPAGFLLIMKILLLGLGQSEYVFRLLPFSCSVLSLVLFAKLAKEHFSRPVQILALFLFVFSDPLIFYSAQLKQYSCDVVIVLLLYVVSLYVLSKPIRSIQVVYLSLLGVFSIFVSHSAVFILAGIAIAHTIVILGGTNKSRYTRHMVVFLLWALGFALIYFLYFHSMIESKAMGYMRAGMLGFQGVGDSFLGVIRFLKNPVHMSSHWLGVPVFLLGIVSLFKRNKSLALQLSLPMLLVILASFLKLYPFQGRFLVFLLPPIFLILSEGIQVIGRKGDLGKVIALTLLIVFFARPTMKALGHITKPRYVAETKKIMQIMKAKQLKGDVLYLNNEAQYAFWYYAGAYQYPSTPRAIGIISDDLKTDERGPYVFLYHNEKDYDSRVYAAGQLVPGKRNPQAHDLSELEGTGRVWILCSQMEPEAQAFFVKRADEKGQRRTVIEDKGAALYLYDFE